jgi:hypothetical protein
VAEILDFASGGGAHLGLVIPQQTAECAHQLVLCDVGSDRLWISK